MPDCQFMPPYRDGMQNGAGLQCIAANPAGNPAQICMPFIPGLRAIPGDIEDTCATNCGQSRVTLRALAPSIAGSPG